MLKTKVKESMLQGLAIKQVIDEVADRIYWKDEKKKPWDVSLKEHLGKMIDRVDPLQLAAIVGTAYIIKFGIDWSKYALMHAVTIISSLDPLNLTGLKQLGPLKLEDNEIIEWVLSFSIAYMVVVHGLDIASGLIPVASKFLAGLAL